MAIDRRDSEKHAMCART